MEPIVVKNLSKKFEIGSNQKMPVFLRLALLISNRTPKKDFWALQNISFTVKAGEIISIIGKNGAGKTTLLKIIADIHTATSGHITTQGKICSLIEPTPFSNRISMKEQIYLWCIFMGLTQKQIRQKINSIVEFSELEKFINTKLYQFSSGMLIRLICSIVLNINVDIIIMDDVNTLLDEPFFKKITAKTQDLKKQGKTFIITSHNLNLIRAVSDRVIWLEEGKVKKIGQPDEIINEYQNSFNN